MSKNKLIGIYGVSGFGREVMPIVRELYSATHSLVFIDDNPELNFANGVEVLNYNDFLLRTELDKYVVLAIADPKVRKDLFLKLEKNDVNILSIKAPNVVILDNNEITEGAIFCPFSMVTSNVKIGKQFHANIYSYVAHDCVIGDFVTFAPGVKCNGNVHVENHAYIGTSAIIKQGTPESPLVIGEGAVVGMGAVVTKSVKPWDVVFGNPAKSIKRGK